MTFSVATWNINSVRLREPIVCDFLKSHQPDVLCLQETKCPNDAFPRKKFEALGYEHIAIHGQKGYHGVATLSKHPLTNITPKQFCGLEDCRYIGVDVQMGGMNTTISNFYVPAGGDEADTEKNPKFAHKLQFLEEMRAIKAATTSGQASVLVGDLNIAPLEHDVWSHKQLLKVVSHTPIETETLEDLRLKGQWADLMREHIPADEKLFTWWSYRSKDWAASNRGRRLDHIWGSANLVAPLKNIEVYSDARSWEKPSDHVPVIATFDL